MHHTPSPYIGRFAPSPSGQLHFGSLVTALASALEAQSHRGKWYLRIENVDTQRERQGATDAIIQTLSAFGFKWDKISIQTDHFKEYEQQLKRLIDQDLAYICHCSRKNIQQHGQLGQEGMIYHQHCRHLHLTADEPPYAYRLKTESVQIQFKDQQQGIVTQNIGKDIGDFILKRRDGIYSYQLAVCTDDENEGITQVVRGADLLSSTPRQIYLQQLLGFRSLEYLHVPLAVHSDGKKLSKEHRDLAITPQHALHNLFNAYAFLGQNTLTGVTTLDAFWQQALAQWDVQKIPQTQAITIHH